MIVFQIWSNGSIVEASYYNGGGFSVDIKEINGRIMYVEGGRVTEPYNGFCWDGLLGGTEDCEYYVVDGYIKYDYTGLVPEVVTDEGDVVWHCVINGKQADWYTGLMANEYGWWYVINGYVNWDSYSFAGLVPNEYGWWYVRNGAVDFNYTGLAYDQNVGWWYVQNGAIDFNYTGLVYDQNVGWWYVQNGAINFNYNGLVCDPYVGWWVVNNGAINFGYTGMIANEYGWWFAVNGTLDFNATGWACNEYGWWLYYNGTIAWNYTGWWDGYYCVNGHLA